MIGPTSASLARELDEYQGNIRTGCNPDYYDDNTNEDLLEWYWAEMDKRKAQEAA